MTKREVIEKISPHLGIVSAAFAIGSWIVSTIFVDYADKAEKRLEAAQPNEQLIAWEQRTSSSLADIDQRLDTLQIYSHSYLDINKVEEHQPCNPCRIEDKSIRMVARSEIKEIVDGQQVVQDYDLNLAFQELYADEAASLASTLPAESPLRIETEKDLASFRSAIIDIHQLSVDWYQDKYFSPNIRDRPLDYLDPIPNWMAVYSAFQQYQGQHAKQWSLIGNRFAVVTKQLIAIKVSIARNIARYKHIAMISRVISGIFFFLGSVLALTGRILEVTGKSKPGNKDEDAEAV